MRHAKLARLLEMGDWKAIIRTGALVISTAVLILKIKASLGDGRRKLTKLSPRTRGVESLIGNTPLIEIRSLSKLTGSKIYAKMELQNPGGSSKDRVALAIIRGAEEKGQIAPGKGDMIFEGTSGSTGISLTLLSNALGYKAHICTQDDTSPEKLQLLRALGAEIELLKPAPIVDPNQYTNAARTRAAKMNADKEDSRNAIFADQFENDFNWRIHYKATGPEIWEQMEEQMDMFVHGSGTGGTISGVAKFLKEKNSGVHVVLADPQGSGLANRVNYGVMYDSVEKEGTRRRHQVDTIIEGIGLNRLTWNFHRGEENIDEAIRVSDEQALKMAKFLSINDGLFWGSSSCINCVAAVEMALRCGPGHKIVLVASDSGARHLSKFWKSATDLPDDLTLDDVLS